MVLYKIFKARTLTLKSAYYSAVFRKGKTMYKHYGDCQCKACLKKEAKIPLLEAKIKAFNQMLDKLPAKFFTTKTFTEVNRWSNKPVYKQEYLNYLKMIKLKI